MKMRLKKKRIEEIIPDWDSLYFLCRKFFNMTKDEFMFDHDYDMVVDLINREIELRTPSEKQDKEVEHSKTHKAKEFFKV